MPTGRKPASKLVLEAFLAASKICQRSKAHTLFPFFFFFYLEIEVLASFLNDSDGGFASNLRVFKSEVLFFPNLDALLSELISYTV